MKLAQFGIDDANLARGMRRLTSEENKVQILRAARTIVNILDDVD